MLRQNTRALQARDAVYPNDDGIRWFILSIHICSSLGFIQWYLEIRHKYENRKVMLHEESFLHECQGLEKGWHLFVLQMKKLVSCYRLQSWRMLAIRGTSSMLYFQGAVMRALPLSAAWPRKDKSQAAEMVFRRE